VRVVKLEGSSTTLYLAPDFEVRDGLATTYVKAGHTSIARVEEPAFATTFFPDVAPLGAGAAAEPAPDGIITAADAWVVHAAKAGLVDLPPPAAAKAKTSDVDKMLASAARRMLGADATQTTYVSHDHLGTPSLETNERGGVVARRWHGPYGEVRGASGAWAEARGFTGKERDETTGLADHGARYLDTRLGRWTAPDPLAVRELGGAELDVYGYVEGRVTAATDPTGLWSSKYIQLGGVTVFEPVHQIAIARVLKDRLPSADVRVLQHQQVVADEAQAPSDQVKHAMRGQGETRFNFDPFGLEKRAAIGMQESFIRGEVRAARADLSLERDLRAQANKLGGLAILDSRVRALLSQAADAHLRALEHTGNAVHALQDATSPSHRGAQVFDPKLGEALAHVFAENRYPAADSVERSELERATSMGVEAVFGQERTAAFLHPDTGRLADR
jgi:RHS repeat-associated protein